MQVLSGSVRQVNIPDHALIRRGLQVEGVSELLGKHGGRMLGSYPGRRSFTLRLPDPLICIQSGAGVRKSRAAFFIEDLPRAVPTELRNQQRGRHDWHTHAGSFNDLEWYTRSDSAWCYKDTSIIVELCEIIDRTRYYHTVGQRFGVQPLRAIDTGDHEPGRGQASMKFRPDLVEEPEYSIRVWDIRHPG